MLCGKSEPLTDVLAIRISVPITRVRLRPDAADVEVLLLLPLDLDENGDKGGN